MRRPLWRSLEEHRAQVERLRDSLAQAPAGPIRLAKSTSNLFRPRDAHQGPRLDVRDFDRTLTISDDGTAEVQGMATFEDFSDACLERGFQPQVVPELKTITVGGAVTGIGIESSSFRKGFVHEALEEIEILCGDGVVRLARPDNEHSDLFRAFPNSYGSLGYALRLRIRLDRARANVRLRYTRFQHAGAFLEAMAAACATESDRPDFVEGVAFGPELFVLSEGRRTDESGPVSPIAGPVPYYQTLRRKTDDLLSARDHLWRWDADWFWCSQAFGLQKPWIRALVGRWMLRSSAYWRILTNWRRWRMEAKVHALKRFLKIPIAFREPVIQDVEIPLENCAEFLDFYWKTIDIRPLWVCPVHPVPASAPWTLYDLPAKLHLNFGFWDSVPTREDLPKGHFNRLLEREVVRLGGHKSLYSSAYFEEDEFWQIYDGPSYWPVKRKYDPRGRLPDLHAKVVRNR